ncbi:hypothetical protein ACFVH4_11745 [Nocardia ignorata]|uniref:hypothetical protein n=1 Tax=Nocardia ignorata TaxID=145285 RepID=UPI0036437E34
MNAQTAKTTTARVLRPSRLNLAGWCMYCIALGCTDARCIKLHAESVWEVCSVCEGSEYSDLETLTRCSCTGGLAEAESPLAAVIDLNTYVVTYPARNDASGLVPRVDAGPSWDYHAAAKQATEDAERANPEAVAYAKANPNDAAAQWAAYGVRY